MLVRVGSWIVLTDRIQIVTLPTLDQLRSKALPELPAGNERLDHLGRNIVACVVIQFCKPEVIAGEINIRRGIRVAPKVTDVLHVDKSAIELALVANNSRNDLRRKCIDRAAR